jgi:hypothetical protein
METAMTGPMYRDPRDPTVSRHGDVHCPNCGKRIDAASRSDGKVGRAPRSGDFAICFGCAEPAVYEIDEFGVRLRAPTPDEWVECQSRNVAVIARLREFQRASRRRFARRPE